MTATIIITKRRAAKTQETTIAQVEKGNSVQAPEMQRHLVVLVVQSAPTLAVPERQVLPDPEPEQMPD